MHYRWSYNKTIEPEGSNRRPTIPAVVAASGLMLVFGLTYRVVAARLEAPVATTPISPEALVWFPLDLGGWKGEEVPLDEKVVQRTGTDAHLNRRYVRRGGFEAVTFYIASGVKARDLLPHRPEVCYKGAGWTRVDKRSVKLPVSDSAPLPCNIMQFSRGILNTERIVVLDYYIVDGQYCGNVSLLRWKACLGFGMVRYVVQVQISTPLLATDDAEAAVKLVSDFAIESAALTAALFDEPATDRSAGDLPGLLKGQ